MGLISVQEPKVKPDSGIYRDRLENTLPAAQYLATLDPPAPESVDRAKARFVERFQITRSMDQSALDDWARGRATLSNLLTWYTAKAGKPLVTVQDFYGTDSTVTSLFPAWIESEIQASLLVTGLVSWLTMGTLQVDSTKVTALYDSTPAAERSLAKMGEGASLPTSKLTIADSIIYLYKFGREIDATYEAIKRQTLDALANHFRRITQQVAIDETDQALHTLIAGDGTTAGAAETNSTDVDVATAGTILFSDLVTWVLAMAPPYKMDKAIGGATDIAQVLNMAEFKDAAYTEASGISVPGPKSVQYQYWAGGVTGSSYVDRLVIGIDSRNALQKYTYGGMIQETDSIINQQIKQFTFSYYAGFRKWDSAACVPLDANAVL